MNIFKTLFQLRKQKQKLHKIHWKVPG